MQTLRANGSISSIGSLCLDNLYAIKLKVDIAFCNKSLQIWSHPNNTSDASVRHGHIDIKQELFSRHYILKCDVIKQNQSEVGNIDFEI